MSKALSSALKAKDSERQEIIKQGRDANTGVFQVGNQVWRLRDEMGRKKLFEPNETNEIEIIAKVKEYFDTKRYYTKTEVVKGGAKSGEVIKYKVAAPYTIEGLCTHLGIDKRSFWNYAKDPNYSVFFPLFTYIDNVIKTQQYESALLGLFDARFVALLNGIKEQVDITSNDESIGITMIRFDLGGIKPINQSISIDDIQESIPIE